MATRVDTWQGSNKSRRKACGECRRLKLRCEKVFPCESCLKRGCAAICPDGSFMKGTRSLKTSALKLHEKMAQMSARIHELEEALSDLQSSVSAEPHPLLLSGDDDDRSRSPIPIASVNDSNIPINESPDELTEAMGTLTIRPFGESQFHGETASSEYLLQVNSNQDLTASQLGWDTGPRLSLQLPADLILLSVLFPFPPSIPGDPINTDRFLPFLPSYREALHISDAYFNHFSWCSLPISRDELHDCFKGEIYIDGREPTSLQKMSIHRLSLILMVFALGCLFDVDKPICPTQAEEFHSLARAALCGEQIFNNTSLECVQSMSLMVWYMRMCPGRRSTGYLWAFSGLLSKLVQAIGLHREPTKTVAPPEVLRRQTTFWEYISGDVWQSFVYGRPSSMVFSQIDCKKPREVGGYIGASGGIFYKWKYSFTHLVGDVLAQTTGATTTNYRGILELERKIREFPIPPELTLQEPSSPGAIQQMPIPLTLQQHLVRLFQHTTIMYIHRRFLVQAIRTNADDLTQSPYIQSVFAAYESACKQTRDLSNLYGAHPRLVSRMHPYWSHTFSASIVLGALVARSPSCEYAMDAMAHLDRAVAIFSDASGRSVQSPTALDVMTNLQRKARIALSQLEGYMEENANSTDELIALGARGQVLEPSQKLRNGSPSSPRLDDPYASHVSGVARNPRRTSSSEVYDPQAHATYAAQWLQQQAYFPPRPSSEGQDHSDTPSSSGGQFELAVDQSEWSHSFMQSMGV